MPVVVAQVIVTVAAVVVPAVHLIPVILRMVNYAHIFAYILVNE